MSREDHEGGPPGSRWVSSLASPPRPCSRGCPSRRAKSRCCPAPPSRRRHGSTPVVGEESFAGASWNAADRAFDSWSVSDFCPSTWIGCHAAAPHCRRTGCRCCVVSAALPDVAEEPAVFCWLTEPPPPGLLTRTGEAWFDAPNCAASDPAKDPCPVFASWPSTWIAEPPAACDCALVRRRRCCRRSPTSRRCSTASRSRRSRGSRREPARRRCPTSCRRTRSRTCRARRPARRPRARATPGRCRPSGRRPGSHRRRSHNRGPRPTGRQSASSSRRCRPWRTSRRCSTA